jgi:hypothetical protein
MMHIIEICDRGTKALDAGRGAVLAASHADVDLGGTGEGAFNVVVYFGGALAQVGPFLGLVGEAVLVGSLGAPDYSLRSDVSWDSFLDVESVYGGGSRGIETRVGAVAFVGISELAMDLGVGFCEVLVCHYVCEMEDRRAELRSLTRELRGLRTPRHASPAINMRWYSTYH